MSKQVRRRGVIDLRKRRPGIRRESLTIPFRKERESLRARRQKLRALALVFCFVLIGAIVYGVSELSYTPKLLINNVSVVGAKEVPPKLVRTYVETKLNDGTNPILSRQNIFLYSRALIEQNIIKYFPRIKEASISRESMLAQVLTVTIEERQPFALWCSEKCYLMDEGGFIFALAPPPAGGLSQNKYMKFSGGLSAQAGLSAASSPIAQTFLPKNFSSVLELIKLLRQAGFAPKGATADDGMDFSVPFDEGFVLRASFGVDANELVRNLQLALSSDPLRGKVNKVEYIDLRFGNRVYYKNRQ